MEAVLKLQASLGEPWRWAVEAHLVWGAQLSWPPLPLCWALHVHSQGRELGMISKGEETRSAQAGGWILDFSWWGSLQN